MADSLLHFATGRVAAIPARGTAFRECLLIGVVAPDLWTKGFGKAMWFLDHRLGYETGLSWTDAISHIPIFWAGMAYALAHLFRAPLRPGVFAGLLLGGWLHILVDIGKETLGDGVTPLFFPFSLAWHEVGWYHHENTLQFAPWALGTVLLVEAGEWLGRRGKGGSKYNSNADSNTDAGAAGDTTAASPPG